ncbi:MAG: hypothetical protein ACXU8R_04560, partial [Xanthobacteraceae bacterium]
MTLAYNQHEVFLVITTSGPAPPTWTPPLGPTADWNINANWTPNTVPGQSDTAQFGTSNATTVNIQQANTQVGGLQFNAGAPAYTFNITGTLGVPSSLVIQGDGVADISGNAPSFVVSGFSGAFGTLQFNNSAPRMTPTSPPMRSARPSSPATAPAASRASSPMPAAWWISPGRPVPPAQSRHGRLDRRRRHLQSRLQYAHRRDQRAEHHG